VQLDDVRATLGHAGSGEREIRPVTTSTSVPSRSGQAKLWVITSILPVPN
jgi:hypothetical protein